MINEYNAKKFCKEDISKIENYEKAINDTKQMWHCHHREEIKVLPSGIKVISSRKELKDNGRYYNCPANELIFLTKSEHRRLHNFNRSKSTKIKMSEAMKGKPTSVFGKSFKEHYGITHNDDKKLYKKEYSFYLRHGKFSWK